MGQLSGRVALVTGAARNIGRAIAHALAAEGAAVVVGARVDQAAADAVVNEILTSGGRAVAAIGDVAQEETAARLVETAISAFGRLDILVNNAAMRREVPFASLELAEWRSVVGVILEGPYLLTRAALPQLIKSGHGAVINLGGLTAYTGAANRAHVIAAKSGLDGLTKALAHELSPQGITVNLVSPGAIDTLRGANAPVDPTAHGGHKTLVGRKGQSEEVAAMVAFLAGPHARYVTGQTIHVNGGAYLP